MAPFLTVREAAQFLGKSLSSVRRLIRPIIRSDDHPDRGLIEPSIEEAMQLRLKGESFGWRVSEELLKREVAQNDGARSEKAAHNPRAGAAANDGALLAMLQRELSLKNTQIQQQAELIANQMKMMEGLGDRIHEGNLLIGSLQQQLALPHPTSRRSATEAQVISPDAKPANEPSKRPPKKRKSWFGW